MNKIDAESFKNRYKQFYFYDPGNPISDEDFDRAGVPKDLNRTNPELEKNITDKISNGIFDAESFAWKAGRAEHFDYSKPLLNGNGYSIKYNKEAEALTGNKFQQYVNNHQITVEKYDFSKEEDRKKLFQEIKKEYTLFNYGTVYIINQMFFLSKGAVPIYDRFAHIAVKALMMDKSPLEVFVPYAPLKNDHPKGKEPIKKDYYLAVNNLEEYMWLLKEVFPDEIHKNGDVMYIPRELDQALWVYGHATEKWTLEDSK